MQLIVSAAGVPQHAAGAAHADDHPVPGHLAGLRDRRLRPAEGLRGRGQELQPARSRCTCSPPSPISSSASACRCSCASCRRRSPSSADRRKPTSRHDRHQRRLQVVRQLPGADRLHDQIKKGEVVVVCGPSGSGKSTLIKTRQCAGAVPEGRHHRRRHLDRRPEDQPAQAARARRHGVPALRAVPAPVGDREPHAGADQGARPQQGRSDDARTQDARSRGPDRRTRTSSRASFPAASSSAWRSPARCRWTRS